MVAVGCWDWHIEFVGLALGWRIAVVDQAVAVGCSHSIAGC